jgi:hypothetical protein
MTVVRILGLLFNGTTGLGESTLPRRMPEGCSLLRRAVAIAVSCLLVAVSAGAQQPKPIEPKPTEYQLKAQYISDFGRFVKKWADRAQPSPAEPFELCVLGQDPFGPILDATVKGEDINGSPMSARRVAHAQEALGCRVLFISSSEENQLAAVLGALGTAPVLTVADIPDFVKRGGMVQFVIDGNRVKFEINLAASQRAGLSLSSDLLKVARLVRRTP